MTVTQVKHALTSAKAIQRVVNEILKPERPQKPDELLTVHEVAIMLRVDDATVRRWVKGGALEAVVLPHVNDRKVYRIRRETVEKLLGE